jgi:MSHA pilin protein MshC
MRQAKNRMARACGVPCGFTLVELVTTLVVLGIIAAVAGPRMFGPDAFKSRGFYDQATATVRYAQKIAIAQRRPVFVCVNAPAVGDISVSYASGCAVQISDPDKNPGDTLKVSAPSGVSLASNAPGGIFSFLSGLGQTSAKVTITLNSTIADDPARSIVIENETGYVHPGP